MSKGRAWPYAIGAAITLVFSFCIATIFITESSAIQESDAYMTKYQDADLNANDFIKKRMAFDILYKIEYITGKISGDSPVIAYRVTTKDGTVLNNATIKIAISRPETDKFDKTLENPSVDNGVYSFTMEKFPKQGVWNIIAKVSIDDIERFLNIKTDTRNPRSYEF
nr:FixH family protein [Sulfurimonas sp. SAG-AH-194-C21]